MGRIGMSQRELRRVEVLARVKSKELKVVDAASLVGVSYRQAKRLWKRYREEGAQGLKHRSAGRASARAKPARFRRRVMKLVREKYGEGEGERFGPTLAAEHLASEDGMQIDAETLRRWMLEEGLWRRRRKRKPYRQRRERRRHFGELVQMDGSFHDWLEERGPGGCLMNMTDDATSEVELRLGEEETIWAAANTLRAWIEKHGVPQALYVDWKNVYKRAPTQREQLRGEEPVTQFGRMCEKLGIEIIAAGSPQAKGRVETQPRHASGPVDQEDEAEEDSDARAGQRVFTAGISAGAQRAVPARGSGGGGLSPAGAERGGVAGSIPAGERADHRQRLGGAIRQSVVSSAGAEPEVRTGARQGGGLRVAGRDDRDRISRKKASVEGDPRQRRRECRQS